MLFALYTTMILLIYQKYSNLILKFVFAYNFNIKLSYFVQDHFLVVSECWKDLLQVAGISPWLHTMSAPPQYTCSKRLKNKKKQYLTNKV